MARINITVDPDFHDLGKNAEQAGMTATAFVRQLIRLYSPLLERLMEVNREERRANHGKR